ncbi:MAG: DUF58 domain-containing protein [Candidatus Marinimicrobia bacterium]|nr:DUF58 domain-containing protein [Candidatus Neomarinimicrobiota bacterium]
MKKKNNSSIENVIQLRSLFLQAKTVVEGFMIGLHKSPYHGFSVEFSEHRPYIAGDDIKHIDWQVYGRTDRYYIKQFQEETNLISYILLDNSKSMSFSSGENNKFNYSSLLAASLIYLLTKQNDATGLTIFNEKIEKLFPPKAVSSYARMLMKELQNTKCKGETNVGLTLHKIAEKLSKKGLIILISDLWDDPDTILNGIKHFRYLGHELIIFHIWDPMEFTLKKDKKVEFVDLESDEKIKLDVRQMKDEYKKLTNEYSEKLKRFCGENNVDYNLITTDTDLRYALMKYLIKRKKLY